MKLLFELSNLLVIFENMLNRANPILTMILKSPQPRSRLSILNKLEGVQCDPELDCKFKYNSVIRGELCLTGPRTPAFIYMCGLKRSESTLV